MKGTDAMKRALSVLGSSLLLSATALAAHPAARVVAPAAGNAPPPDVAATDQDEMPRLLSRLNELSEFIAQNMQSPQLWRYQLAQGEVLLQIAARCKPEERDSWLKMAVDNYQSAAVLSPDSDISAHQR